MTLTSKQELFSFIYTLTFTLLWPWPLNWLKYW